MDILFGILLPVFYFIGMTFIVLLCIFVFYAMFSCFWNTVKGWHEDIKNRFFKFCMKIVIIALLILPVWVGWQILSSVSVSDELSRENFAFAFTMLVGIGAYYCSFFKGIDDFRY